MIVFNLFQKLILFPAYYFFHHNIFFGFFHKYFIRFFFYKKIKIELNVKDIPLSHYSSFLFKTYEYNDRKLIENNLNSNNKCVIIGGGLGFIPALSYLKTNNKILVFEINKKIIKNLQKNLLINKCKYDFYNFNLKLEKPKSKYETFYLDKNFLATSMYIKTKKMVKVSNIHYTKIKQFNNYNTLIIDGEGIEQYFIENIKKLKNIKYLFFELHHNIFNKNQINAMFNILKQFKFKRIDKCFNSFYYKRN
jgi:hypothetical protein